MKAMKEKKVFSLVNLVGLGVFFFMLATAVFFFLRRATYATIVLRVSQTDVLEPYYGLPMWYLDNLKPGMEQKDIFGRSVISIVKNFSYPNNSNSRVVYLTIKLLTTFDKKSGIYNYEGVPLLVGSYQTLRIKDILLRGVIHRVENKDFQAEKKSYIVEGFINPSQTVNQDPYVAETMTEGIQNYLADKIVKGLKISDSDGGVIVDVLEVKKETSYRKFIFQNRLVEVPDSDRKKVKVKMQIVTEKYGDVFLFRNESTLKVNDNIFLNFGDFEIPLTITNIK